MNLKKIGLITLFLLMLLLIVYSRLDRSTSKEAYIVTASVECMIRSIHVASGQTIQKDQPLFDYEETIPLARFETARKNNELLKAEMHRTYLLGAKDASVISKKLPALRFKLKKNQIELSFAKQHLKLASEKSPIAGVVTIDDKDSWVGKTVKPGEHIMTIKASD